MHSLSIKQVQNSLLLCGELTRRTVHKSFEKKSSRMLSKAVQFIDLSEVTQSDTAGLAWLLLMVERANQQAFSVKITNIPQELLKLAKLSAVDSFLPVE